MNQTLDSLDRLSLFPMLDYQIAPQTTVYRGAKISEAGIRKRCKWSEAHRDCFLLWRRRLDEGRLHMDPAARGLSNEHAHVDKALSKGGDWGAFQSALQEPLMNISLRLETLVTDGHLHYAEAKRPETVTVDRVRYRLASMAVSLGLVACGIYLVPCDYERVKEAVTEPLLQTSRAANVSFTRAVISSEAERYREKHGRYPSASVMAARLATMNASKLRDGTSLYRFQYIGLGDEFVVLTSISDSDGEQQ